MLLSHWWQSEPPVLAAPKNPTFPIIMGQAIVQMQFLHSQMLPCSLVKSPEEENIPIYVTAKTCKRTMKGMKANRHLSHNAAGMGKKITGASRRCCNTLWTPSLQLASASNRPDTEQIGWPRLLFNLTDTLHLWDQKSKKAYQKLPRSFPLRYGAARK